MIRSLWLAVGLSLVSPWLLADARALWTYGKKDGVSSPESAYFDKSTKSFYVSNIAGEGTAKDKIGWISKISQDGKQFKLKWVEGLNAPKGIRVHSDRLWVADIDELVEIDLKTARILNRYPASDAKFLNDIAITKAGELYVSDTQAEKIFRLRQGKLEVFTDRRQLEAPNGLLVEGDTLYVATWGHGIKPDWSTTTPGSIYGVNLKTKKMRPVTPSPLGHLDGLERHPDNGFLTSDWMTGKVYSVGNDGKPKELLKEIKGAADIGIDPQNRILVVPAMQEDEIIAYFLE